MRWTVAIGSVVAVLLITFVVHYIKLKDDRDFWKEEAANLSLVLQESNRTIAILQAQRQVQETTAKVIQDAVTAREKELSAFRRRLKELESEDESFADYLRSRVPDVVFSDSRLLGEAEDGSRHKSPRFGR